jgi:putative transposase
VRLILEENSRYGWGPRKILKRLRLRYPGQSWPARSTVFDILARHGRVIPRDRRRHWKHPGAAPVNTTAPNQTWTVDFNGQFRMHNGVYCYPLTILDHHSRYLLCGHGLTDIGSEYVNPQFLRLSRGFGLPDGPSSFPSKGRSTAGPKTTSKREHQLSSRRAVKRLTATRIQVKPWTRRPKAATKARVSSTGLRTT